VGNLETRKKTALRDLYKNRRYQIHPQKKTEQQSQKHSQQEAGSSDGVGNHAMIAANKDTTQGSDDCKGPTTTEPGAAAPVDNNGRTATANFLRASMELTCPRPPRAEIASIAARDRRQQLVDRSRLLAPKVARVRVRGIPTTESFDPSASANNRRETSGVVQAHCDELLFKITQVSSSGDHGDGSARKKSAEGGAKLRQSGLRTTDEEFGKGGATNMVSSQEWKKKHARANTSCDQSEKEKKWWINRLTGYMSHPNNDFPTVKLVEQATTKRPRLDDGDTARDNSEYDTIMQTLLQQLKERQCGELTGKEVPPSPQAKAGSEIEADLPGSSETPELPPSNGIPSEAQQRPENLSQQQILHQPDSQHIADIDSENQPSIDGFAARVNTILYEKLVELGLAPTGAQQRPESLP